MVSKILVVGRTYDVLRDLHTSKTTKWCVKRALSKPSTKICNLHFEISQRPAPLKERLRVARMEMFARGPHGEMMMRPGFGPPATDMRTGRPAMSAAQYGVMPGYPGPRGYPPHMQRMARPAVDMAQVLLKCALVLLLLLKYVCCVQFCTRSPLQKFSFILLLLSQFVN